MLNDFLEDLRTFRPISPQYGPELTISEQVVIDEEADRLIRLTTRFASALGPEVRDELLRRSGTLERETAEGTPFDSARRAAVRDFLGPLHPEHTFDQLLAGFGAFETGERGLLFPVQFAAKVMFTKGKMGAMSRDGPEVAGRRWLAALGSLRERVEGEHYWGSLVIQCCREAQQDAEEGHVLHGLLREYLRVQVRAAHAAVADAAADLVRWGRSRDPGTTAGAAVHAARYSDDFRSVVWVGQTYSFTASQAGCVAVLWRSWERGTPEVGDHHLLTEVDSAGVRLVDLFAGHPAWGR